MANFDDLQGAVAQFGANNKVIFDDTGMPSIMVAVPKAKYSDVITGGTDETLPFWIMEDVYKRQECIRCRAFFGRIGTSIK